MSHDCQVVRVRWRKGIRTPIKKRRGSQQCAAALLSRSGFPFEDVHLDLIRKNGKMVGQPVKHLSLLSIGCKIPDQRAFSSVFAELLCLCR